MEIITTLCWFWPFQLSILRPTQIKIRGPPLPTRDKMIKQHTSEEQPPVIGPLMGQLVWVQYKYNRIYRSRFGHPLNSQNHILKVISNSRIHFFLTSSSNFYHQNFQMKSSISFLLDFEKGEEQYFRVFTMHTGEHRKPYVLSNSCMGRASAKHVGHSQWRHEIGNSPVWAFSRACYKH